MSTVPARTGRLRQRYEDNFRLVSGPKEVGRIVDFCFSDLHMQIKCIPYRYRKGSDDQEEEDAKDLIEVLMVSSPNRNDLVFPKGGWEDDETVIEAACREALEEAGVKGIPREFPLGRWEFKSKSSQDILSLEGGCRGYMFALEVTEELETWPEKNNRDRLWLNIREAFRLCRYDWMCRALEEFLRVVAEDRELKRQKEQVDPPSIPLTKSYKRPSNAQHHIGFCSESMASSNSFQFDKEQTVK